MRSTLRNLIQELIKEGHEIEYRERTDRGIVVTSIDGVKYKGKRGNQVVRSLTGASLSRAQRVQLHDLSLIKKGKREVTRARAKRIMEGETFSLPKPRGRKRVEPLPEEFQKELRKLQYLWRKNQVKAKGKPTTKKLRQLIEYAGKERSLEYLKRQQMYAKGYTYPEAVVALVDIVTSFYGIVSVQNFDGKEMLAAALDKLNQLLKSHLTTFREEWFSFVKDYLYEAEKFYKSGAIPEATNAINNAIKVMS